MVPRSSGFHKMVKTATVSVILAVKWNMQLLPTLIIKDRLAMSLASNTSVVEQSIVVSAPVTTNSRWKVGKVVL